MQFDSQELIQFWQDLIKGQPPDSAKFAENAAKLFQFPQSSAWQSVLDQPQVGHPNAVNSVNHMAGQLRDFLSQLSHDWQDSRSPFSPVTDSLAAGATWNRFLDLGSTQFQAFANSPDFSRQLASCINAFAQTQAPDLRHGLGDYGPALTDTDPLHGERDAIYSNGTMTLYRYAPQGEPRVMAPVLIVYALINTADILDLDPERSLISALLQQGIPVYLIDWGFPQPSDAELGLDDYVHGRLKPAIDEVLKDAASDQLSLFGVCQGGILALSTAALYPGLINKVALAVTPIDFHTPDNLLSRWAQDVDVSALVKQHGNIPGSYLYWLFASLNPFELIYRKYLKAATTVNEQGQFDQGALRRFMRMERWVQNVPDHAGRAFEQFVKTLYQDNALMQDEFSIDGARVRLADLQQPVLSFYGTRDHIVPAASARALASHLKYYEEVELQGGHIGALVSARNIIAIATRLGAWL